jgi:hypothetical protein
MQTVTRKLAEIDEIELTFRKELEKSEVACNGRVCFVDRYGVLETPL